MKDAAGRVEDGGDPGGQASFLRWVSTAAVAVVEDATGAAAAKYAAGCAEDDEVQEGQASCPHSENSAKQVLRHRSVVGV